MPNKLKYSKPLLFSNDTHLISSSKCVDIMQSNIQYDIFSLTHWILSNKLRLHVKRY